MRETPAPNLTSFAIDEDLCTGCGLCRETAPDNIGAGRSGLSRVVLSAAHRCHEESRCQEAVRHVPDRGAGPLER